MLWVALLFALLALTDPEAWILESSETNLFLTEAHPCQRRVCFEPQ